VKEGRFREGLFYRINVIPIKMPPLRERAEDVPQLAEFLIQRYNGRFRKQIRGITETTMTVLKKYWWPGNIRELENLVERLVAVSDKDYISEEDLRWSSTSRSSNRQTCAPPICLKTRRIRSNATLFFEPSKRTRGT
jgi:transcriptional regulator with PAS, ATPase and Fis domain